MIQCLSKPIVDQVHITIKKKPENGSVVPFVTGKAILKLNFRRKKNQRTNGPVNAHLIYGPGSEKMIFEDFYHIWAWQSSLSCDQNHVNKFSFPFPSTQKHTCIQNLV